LALNITFIASKRYITIISCVEIRSAITMTILGFLIASYLATILTCDIIVRTLSKRSKAYIRYIGKLTAEASRNQVATNDLTTCAGDMTIIAYNWRTCLFYL